MIVGQAQGEPMASNNNIQSGHPQLANILKLVPMSSSPLQRIQE
jgi:hypothetical protein